TLSYEQRERLFRNPFGKNGRTGQSVRLAGSLGPELGDVRHQRLAPAGEKVRGGLLQRWRRRFPEIELPIGCPVEQRAVRFRPAVYADRLTREFRGTRRTRGPADEEPCTIVEDHGTEQDPVLHLAAQGPGEPPRNHVDAAL